MREVLERMKKTLCELYGFFARSLLPGNLETQPIPCFIVKHVEPAGNASNKNVSDEEADEGKNGGWRKVGERKQQRLE